MNYDDTVVYRLSPSNSLIFILAGLFMLVAAIGGLITSYPPKGVGDTIILEYLVLFFLAFVMLPLGITGLMLPFMTGITRSRQGLVYHALTHTVKADWEDILKIRDTEAGNVYFRTPTVKLVLDDSAEVIVKKWAYILPWDIVRGAKEEGMPISRYSRSGIHRILSDIRTYAPHLSEDENTP